MVVTIVEGEQVMTSKLPKYVRDILLDIPYHIEEEIFNILHPIKHLVPTTDYRQHELSADCWCEPDIDGDVCCHNLLIEPISYTLH